jgi:hypothetical protein
MLELNQRFFVLNLYGPYEGGEVFWSHLFGFLVFKDWRSNHWRRSQFHIHQGEDLGVCG